MVDHPDELLFSYGMLQDPEVQLDLFGRVVEAHDDVLSGYHVDYVEFEDPRVMDASGLTMHPIVRKTDDPRDKVTGRVLHLTEDELDAADEYEVALYRRGSVTLRSGRIAWVYLSA